jgi:2-polyprenyl-6-methoxyphenol hydroxylase-like FAD-dependent oxidoreductase
LTLARQLHRELPDLRVLTLEAHSGNYPEGPLKVGESLTELSSFYMTKVLGLEEYLRTQHLRKMGLRFFFPPQGDGFASRPELGSSKYDPVDSFQVSRGKLENDLRRFNADDGIEALEGRKVVAVELGRGGEPHLVRFVRRGRGEEETVRARWVVDAMGRRRFLQKQLGLALPYTETCSSAWFRVEGRLQLSELVPRSEEEWHRRVPEDGRYFSTSHLMGNGHWCWLIPLAIGATSIGIVSREDCMPFTEYNTPEKAMAWLAAHQPELHSLLAGHKLLDFKRLRHASYTSEQVFSTGRWSCVGDAAVFSDPFFSPGIDQVGFGNCVTVEMIRRDLAGELTEADVEHFNQVYLSYNHGATWITQPAYHFFGCRVAMAGKLLWDIIRGWAINGPQRFEKVYLDRELSEEVLDASAPLTLLAVRMARLFDDWSRRPSRASYSFVDYSQVPGVDELYHRSLRSGRDRQTLLDDFRRTADYLEDLALALFRVAVEDTLPDQLHRLPPGRRLNAWAVGLDPTRWEEDGLFAPPSGEGPVEPMQSGIRRMFFPDEAAAPDGG